MGATRIRQELATVQRGLAAFGAVLALGLGLSVSATAPAHAAPGDQARTGGTTIDVAAGLPVFAGHSARLSAGRRAAMTGPVWRKGCPVGLGSLRLVTARYVGFDGRMRHGAIVVHKVHAAATVRVLRRLYEARFPIRRMQPIEKYDGSDDASIEADNTSAFNCRAVTGGTGWSEHSYGRAIDLNPIENPYVYANGTSSHKASGPYLKRSTVRPGMAVPGGILVRAFSEQGWHWGGTWSPIRDYQHFSPTGR